MFSLTPLVVPADTNALIVYHRLNGNARLFLKKVEIFPDQPKNFAPSSV